MSYDVMRDIVAEDQRAARRERVVTSRDKFEAWARENFQCDEYSFKMVPGTLTYFRQVYSRAISGQVTGECCSVQILWEAWHASRNDL